MFSNFPFFRNFEISKTVENGKIKLDAVIYSKAVPTGTKNKLIVRFR